MGFDLSGLAPENTSNLVKPSINWNEAANDEERSQYFNELDKYQKEEIDFKTKEPTGRMFTDYPFEDVKIDGC